MSMNSVLLLYVYFLNVAFTLPLPLPTSSTLLVGRSGCRNTSPSPTSTGFVASDLGTPNVR